MSVQKSMGLLAQFHPLQNGVKFISLAVTGTYPAQCHLLNNRATRSSCQLCFRAQSEA